jgi:hypothetical protein
MSCSFLFPSSDIRTPKERARSEGNYDRIHGV